jgi:hypothetical protein
MAQTAVTGFSEPFLDTHPFYRGTYFRTVARTATGPGNGTAESASGRTVTRLDRLVDYHTGFYKNGGRFYLGVRAIITVTATASGTGTASSSASVLRQRQGTDTGTGSQSATGLAVIIRSATGSGVGTMDSTGLVIHFYLRTATGSGTGTSAITVVRAAVRTASDTGTGTGTADWNINPVRTATGSGTGTSTILVTRVVLRTSSGEGEGTSASTRVLTAIRTATGSGTGSGTLVGARTRRTTATGAGDGTATANWDKSHIFRVPITEGYPFAERLSEESADRLFSFTPQGARAKNLYRLTDGSYTTTDPRRPELITRIYYGGHDIFLTDPEITELTAAGYGSSIT